MGLVQVTGAELIKLTALVLVLSCVTSVLGDVVNTVYWTQPPHHAPIYPPVGAPHHHKGGHHKAPSHPPALSPSHPPAHPPTSYPVPIRKLVAVRGVVYCTPCKNFLRATPILGAIVRLECKNTKYKPLVQEAKTDKNGYFFIMAPKRITTYASHKCKVYLVSSPLSKCKKPTNLNYGLKGAMLLPSKPTIPSLLQVFNVGPFAFEPTTKFRCPR